MISFSSKILLLLSNKAICFSLFDTIKIIKLNNTINIWKVTAINPNLVINRDNIMIIIDDLKKTVYLKTAIIEKEWMIRLKKDIFVGPKYLDPLIESVSLKFEIYFFTEPEKLLHKLFLSESFLTSLFVKQQ